MTQIIIPNPNIPCKPGWCLAYVNQAFRVPIRYPSATAAWNASATKHRDQDFPDGVWVPVWFSLLNEPNGHVALRAPDGRYFSTTHPTALTPTEHPNLAHLLNAYARFNPLTYLGWTEDVEGTPVVSLGGIQFQSGTTTTPIQEDSLANFEEADIERIVKKAIDGWSKDYRTFAGNRNQLDTFAQTQAEHEAILAAINAIPANVLFENRVDGRNIVDTGRQGLANDAVVLATLSGLSTGSTVTAADIAAAIPEDIAQQVVDALAARLVK